MRTLLCLLVSALCLAPGKALCARRPVHARHAMVVTVEPHATDIGVAVLKSGGNAVDAAVAVGFALAVTHPSAGNLGGGGFLLVRFADGRTTFLDFRERAPATASRDMYLDAAGKATEDSMVGYRASGVPGTVAGLEFAHRKYGRKAWADVGRSGTRSGRQRIPRLLRAGRFSQRKRAPAAISEESKRIFLKDGRFYEPDDILIQPELARTLERIAREGAKDFYEGETARLLAADMKAHGGLITLDDLKNYTVVDGKPLTGSYRGYSIITAPPPSSGGVGILQMLGVLEGRDTRKPARARQRPCITWPKPCAAISPIAASIWAIPNSSRSRFDSSLDRRYIADLRRSIDPARATPSDRCGRASSTAYESPPRPRITPSSTRKAMWSP